jgi:hypothetical protein
LVNLLWNTPSEDIFIVIDIVIHALLNVEGFVHWLLGCSFDLRSLIRVQFRNRGAVRDPERARIMEPVLFPIRSAFCLPGFWVVLVRVLNLLLLSYLFLLDVVASRRLELRDRSHLFEVLTFAKSVELAG